MILEISKNTSFKERIRFIYLNVPHFLTQADFFVQKNTYAIRIFSLLESEFLNTTFLKREIANTPFSLVTSGKAKYLFNLN